MYRLSPVSAWQARNCSSHPQLAGKGGGVVHPADPECAPRRRQQSAAALQHGDPPAPEAPLQRVQTAGAHLMVARHIAAGICPTQGGHQGIHPGVAPGVVCHVPRQEDGVGRLGLDGGEQPPLRPSIKCAVQVGEQQQAHWGGKLVRMQGVAAQSQSLPQGGRQDRGPRQRRPAYHPFLRLSICH